MDLYIRIYLSRACSSGTKASKEFPHLLQHRHLRVRCVHASFQSVLSSRARSRTFTILEHLLENVSSPVGRVRNDADHLVKSSSRWHDHCRGAVAPIAAIIAAANRIKHVYCAPWFDARAFIAWYISFRFPIIRIPAHRNDWRNNFLPFYAASRLSRIFNINFRSRYSLI